MEKKTVRRIEKRAQEVASTRRPVVLLAYEDGEFELGAEGYHGRLFSSREEAEQEAERAGLQITGEAQFDALFRGL